MKRKNDDAAQPPSILGLVDPQPAGGCSGEKTGELPKVADESLEGTGSAEAAKVAAGPADPVFGFRKKTMWGF